MSGCLCYCVRDDLKEKRAAFRNSNRTISVSSHLAHFPSFERSSPRILGFIIRHISLGALAHTLYASSTVITSLCFLYALSGSLVQANKSTFTWNPVGNLYCLSLGANNN